MPLDTMKRFVLTGTPGCGKTTLIRALEHEKERVVEEAATDVIALEQARGEAAPWESLVFIDRILALQKQRQWFGLISEGGLSPRSGNSWYFYDRSPFCTYALALYLKITPPLALEQELEDLIRGHFYDSRVFFIENLGFCAPTPARTITFEEALVFEKIHEDVYKKFGFQCLRVPAGPLSDRLQTIYDYLGEK